MLETITTILTSTAVISFCTSLVTMFIDETKLAKYGPIVQAVTGFLNTLSLNVLNNKNATALAAETTEVDAE